MSRTARFAEFLRAAIAIKTKSVTEVNKYPTVIWFSNLPTGLDDVRSPLLQADWPIDDVRWLVVSRVPEPDRPLPPEACLPWLADVPLDVPAAPPTLNAHYSNTNDRGEVVEIPPDSDTLERWDRYVTRDWAKWATKASIARAIKPLYQSLFAAYQQLQGRDDAYDLFVGVGLLDSRTDPAQRLHRHLFAFRAELSLDKKSGALTLDPSAEFVSLRVETDFLPAADRARLQPQLDDLQVKFAELGPKLHDRAAVGDLLTRLVHSLDGNTQYINILSPQDAPPGQARASFAPALILRPKSTRSLDELLARIQADASGPEPKVAMESTPISWRRMMEDSRVWGGEGGGGGGQTTNLPDERVYFPLPSNEEQSRIVRFAKGSAGVVVQGPPGTGKSHTIANLISHYLATGQRVLVTAQSAQALEVLREKMPADLQQLCVSMLGNTKTSDEDLQRSVAGILARLQDFDRATYERRIALLEAELTKAEIRLNGLDRTLRESRAAETEALDPVVDYHGTRAQIARQLRDERVRFAWIKDDPIPHRTSCPTFAFGWARLADYHRSLDEEIRRRLSRQYIALPFTRDQAIDVVERINRAREAVPPEFVNDFETPA